MILAGCVHQISGLVSNCYLIEEPDGLTLIDTGMPGAEKKVLALIARLGRTPAELSRILITHGDGDHIGALNVLMAVSGATVSASEHEANAIRQGIPSRPLSPQGAGQKLVYALLGNFIKPQPAVVDEILTPGQTLPILEGLQVLDTCGHTPGHLSYYLPEKRILFAGDSIKGSAARPLPSSGANNWDSVLSQRSFEAQLALKPAWICAGHTLIHLDD